VSAAPPRAQRLSIRLSPEELAALDALAARFALDRSATVRRLLALAAPGPAGLPDLGWFVALPGPGPAFPIRLKGKASHDR